MRTGWQDFTVMRIIVSPLQCGTETMLIKGTSARARKCTVSCLIRSLVQIVAFGTTSHVTGSGVEVTILVNASFEAKERVISVVMIGQKSLHSAKTIPILCATNQPTFVVSIS